MRLLNHTLTLVDVDSLNDVLALAEFERLRTCSMYLCLLSHSHLMIAPLIESLTLVDVNPLNDVFT
ncbi:hypothetical protein AB6F53_07430 [Staphylococcus haemolyticus]